MLGSLLFMVTATASRLRRVTFGEMVIKVLAPFLDPDDKALPVMTTNALSPAQTVPVFRILIEGSGLKIWVTAKLTCMLTRTIAMMAYRSSFMMRPIRASALVLSSNGITIL